MKKMCMTHSILIKKSHFKNSAGQTKIFYLGTWQISRALDSPLSENSLATPIL